MEPGKGFRTGPPGGNSSRPEGKNSRPAGGNSPLKKWMSVKELGELLGLKKTDRYWLLHKGYFETMVLAGKTWISVRSFERWYANQVKYHKVNGEEAGKSLKRRSYSIRDFAGMIGVNEQTVYGIVKREGIRTILVDGWTRIPREAFDAWYTGQNRYRTEEDRRKDAEMEDATITMPEMAHLLGIPRCQVYSLLKGGKRGSLLETVVIAGKRRVTRESFQRFLSSQDKFYLIKPDSPQEQEPERGRQVKKGTAGNNPAKRTEQPEAAGGDATGKETPAETRLLTINMAAQMAGVSRQAVSKALEKGCFTCIKQGGLIRIPREGFEAWLESRKRMVE